MCVCVRACVCCNTDSEEDRKKMTFNEQPRIKRPGISIRKALSRNSLRKSRQ